jgi:epoxide hydrolase-like predicted phosphatase
MPSRDANFPEDDMPIKAVIWDIGGVIGRTEDRGPRAKLADDLGVSYEHLVRLIFSGEQGARAQLGEITVDELFQYVRKELGLAPGEFPDLYARFFAGDRVDYELVDFIRSLKPKYKIGIISNAWGDLHKMLDQWGITDAFDIIVGSGDEGILKPDPKIYKIALERLGVKPEEAVFIDDFNENIEGARKQGINTIHFKNRDQALLELNHFLFGD